MFRTPIKLVAAAFLFNGAALAQETTDTAEPATESPTTEQVDNGLDLGQPVDETVKVGQRYDKEKFGDWSLNCLKMNAGKDLCSLLQVINGPQDVPMAEFSMFRLPEGGSAVAGANILVPLETLLQAQLTLSIDGAPAKRYNYSFCNPVGCVAQIGLTQGDIDAMKQGSKATLTIVPAPAPDQVIELDLSLSGFTAGYDIVDVATN
ncbi:invasion associated locus B family protein [Ruegeria faecimaris]|uniref:invasion associated locus B family protein n=1 Tax=Ruegeria faecimaris TaxID=686389 RepID=UPI00249216F0|nr:invasion associated locus B family protein [Ruegeria faecimaris]